MNNLRFLKITTFYTNYLQHFYTRHPQLNNAPYEVQFGRLMGDCFGWADFFARNLQTLGHEAGEIVANAEDMQKQWAREHNVAFDEQAWKKQIRGCANPELQA